MNESDRSFNFNRRKNSIFLDGDMKRNGKDLLCSITGMEFVYVAGGEFYMGNNIGGGSICERPVHKVTVDEFLIGKYPVTQGEWKKIIGDNPSFHKLGDRYPVERVSWHDAQRFIQTINSLSNRKHRLPSEAEWEYACRSGGKDQKYSGGNNPDELAWFSPSNNNKKKKESTCQVGHLKPNDLGIFDMSGNVSEWVNDIYSFSYYSISSTNNPTGPSDGDCRVFRGGSWFSTEYDIRCVARRFWYPDLKSCALGFRVLLDISEA
ncbi:MAG: SUMF1/EgtB/PvdO family nonheme iron enzyme [Magnetococcales bacterium]|nr:SUMF1/EgtB/PvdO family nonheme iron enzyme [Magnetococcales bacterium]